MQIKLIANEKSNLQLSETKMENFHGIGDFEKNKNRRVTGFCSEEEEDKMTKWSLIFWVGSKLSYKFKIKIKEIQ